MTGWLAIATGDPTGIGPEITLKALAQELKQDDTKYLLLGDLARLMSAAASANVSIEPFVAFEKGGRVQGMNPAGKALPADLPSGAALAAKLAVACVEEGARLCLKGQTDALVTAPVNKEAIVRAGFREFVGQTEFLSSLAGVSRTGMMLLGPDDRERWLRVVLATTHLPLRKVAESLSTDKIQLAIALASEACKHLRLAQARVAVCGLNPHAGEGGILGDEEETIIQPAIKVCQQAGLDVHGPFSADALFYYALRGDYDAVVAMYHDQGLAPLKMAAFERGVNWTLGLPFVRTSPDHGTAYDIAGKDRANCKSMLAAIRLAKQLIVPSQGSVL